MYFTDALVNCLSPLYYALAMSLMSRTMPRMQLVFPKYLWKERWDVRKGGGKKGRGGTEGGRRSHLVNLEIESPQLLAQGPPTHVPGPY